MGKFSKAVLVLAMATFLAACRVEYEDDSFTNISIQFEPAFAGQSDWAASVVMLTHYYGYPYSQSEILSYQYFYTGSWISLYDLSDLIWDLSGREAIVTGLLSWHDVRHHVSAGRPILLQLGDYFDERFVVLYGFDDYQNIYVYDPQYGVRVIDYHDLVYGSGHGFGARFYWSGSLVVW